MPNTSDLPTTEREPRDPIDPSVSQFLGHSLHLVLIFPSCFLERSDQLCWGITEKSLLTLLPPSVYPVSLLANGFTTFSVNAGATVTGSKAAEVTAMS